MVVQEISRDEAVAAIKRGLAGIDKISDSIIAMYRTLVAFHCALAIRDLYRDAWRLTGGPR